MSNITNSAELAAPRSVRKGDSRSYVWFTYILSLALGLTIWWTLSFVYPPIFLPSPAATAATLIKMLSDGELAASAAVSLMRIICGWALGGVIGTLLGIWLGWFSVARQLFQTPIQYLRFVPPVTLVTLFIIWFGVGEASKIILIAWVSMFVMIVNTMAGVLSVRSGAIRAAQCLGATNIQVLAHVVIPETVPYVVTGAQLALSNAFMTIVAAEMLAAKSGLGFMIWDAQVYAQTDRVFVAFVALSVFGFLLDRTVHGLSKKLFEHYKVV
jgi:ABC-type nitrate/sulfonate/bicarbonate transport system permease component